MNARFHIERRNNDEIQNQNFIYSKRNKINSNYSQKFKKIHKDLELKKEKASQIAKNPEFVETNNSIPMQSTQNNLI